MSILSFHLQKVSPSRGLSRGLATLKVSKWDYQKACSSSLICVLFSSGRGPYLLLRESFVRKCTYAGDLLKREELKSERVRCSPVKAACEFSCVCRINKSIIVSLKWHERPAEYNPILATPLTQPVNPLWLLTYLCLSFAPVCAA